MSSVITRFRTLSYKYTRSPLGQDTPGDKTRYKVGYNVSGGHSDSELRQTNMKLLGIVALVALLFITSSDGKRQRKRRIDTSVAVEVAELKAKVENLTAQVHELQEQSRGVHIHIGGDHHDHHGDHDTDHHMDTHDDHGSHGSHDDDSDTTNTDGGRDSTNVADDTDSTSSNGGNTRDHDDHDDHDDHHHDNGHHHNEHHHSHHPHHDHSGHSDNHYQHAHDVYVNMKLDGGCSHDDKHPKAYHEEHEINAHCEMMPNKEIADLTYKIRGHVKLTQKPGEDEVSIRYDLRNLKPSQRHAIHIHESGNMERCCDSLGGHYNPYNKQHGLPNTHESHVGDVGNIAVDDQGHYTGEQIITADLNQLVGRAFVIHEASDTGEGSEEERLACCVIGRGLEDHNHDHHGHDDHHDHHDHHGHHDRDHHDHDHHDHDHHDHDGHHDHSDGDEHHENQDNPDQQG